MRRYMLVTQNLFNCLKDNLSHGQCQAVSFALSFSLSANSLIEYKIFTAFPSSIVMTISPQPLSVTMSSSARSSLRATGARISEAGLSICQPLATQVFGSDSWGDAGFYYTHRNRPSPCSSHLSCRFDNPRCK